MVSSSLRLPFNLTECIFISSTWFYYYGALQRVKKCNHKQEMLVLVPVPWDGSLIALTCIERSPPEWHVCSEADAGDGGYDIGGLITLPGTINVEIICCVMGHWLPTEARKSGIISPSLKVTFFGERHCLDVCAPIIQAKRVWCGVQLFHMSTCEMMERTKMHLNQNTHTAISRVPVLLGNVCSCDKR